MCCRRHFGASVLIALVASIWLSPSAGARFVNLPPGWTDEVTESLWIVRSPRDARGGVDFVMPVAIPYDGDFEPWFSAFAPMVGTALGGRIVSQQPPDRTIGGVNSYGLAWSMRLTAEDDAGRRSDIVVVAYPGTIQDNKYAGKAQMLAILAPSGVARPTGSADGRWRQALGYAVDVARTFRLILTSEFLAHVRETDAKARMGGAGQQTAPSPTAMADSPPSTVWSARSGGRGVVFLSPCRADSQPILAGVRRREYVMAINLPKLVRDEAREAVRAWSGGASPSFADHEQDGATAAVVTRFKMQGREFAAWFAARKRSDNYVQLGFVLMPADRGQDGAVSEAVATVRSELENETTAELRLEGAPPATGGDGSVEAVLAMSGLALAEENRALSLQWTPIALYRNGMATDTARRLRGSWQRLEGAYEVDFTGTSGGYSARISASCVSKAAVANAPPSPSAPPGQAAKGCRYEMVRKTNYAIFCGTVPGTVAPRTCPAPTSTWAYEMVCG